MNSRIHLFVSRKNPLTWITAILLLSSAIFRIVFCSSLTEAFWSEIFLPAAASILFAAILLLNGKEAVYRTAVSVWIMAAYAGIYVTHHVDSKLVIWLFWVVFLFLAALYTDIISGNRPKSVWLLFPAASCTLATVLYTHRAVILARSWSAFAPILPDVFALAAFIVFVFCIRVHPMNESHRTWGDRSDGRRIRTLAAMDQVSPYIMVTRNTASNTFEESFEISNVDRYIRAKRREGLTNFGIMHVFLACYCRAVAKYPGLNRFISGQKVYTHGEDIQFCLTIKKEMSTKSPETIVKVHLSPKDTVYDVYNKVNEQVEKAKNTPLDSGFDNTAHALMLIPGVVLKFVVWMLKTMDYFGLLPPFLLEVSPFHGSIFLTSMGSLGIPPIYHHLYDFGNLPVFGSFGCKRREMEIQDDGTLVPRKYVDFKFTLDERIVDGYYYAAFFKHYKRIISHPEVLDCPPEEINRDID